ncbi:hypothetical protein E3J59_01290 [Candidatus Aerophobetes bacterium]|uniref:Uncharacterized protein n=1 Tax=Aerophobetes bacterium TaxID=2030807 RepID=A0A523UZT2_UNCAE|nr:MAG: hypothetical protein E3J59_01290 [Candidatus Aerophobetes bacterium]
MRRILVLLSIATLGFATIISYSLASQNTLQPSLIKKHLDNLNLLVNLSHAGISTPKTATIDPKDYQQKTMTGKIIDVVETDHALIFLYDAIEIPDFLSDNFDRIFTMTMSYLNLKDTNDKLVLWVMQFETLQQIPFGPETCFAGCPSTFGALYAPLFDYLLFTPEYVNDYYVTHELLHYFIDEYEKQVAAGLPKIIRKKYQSDVLGYNFLKHKEEEIVIDLSKIIIHESLATSLLPT